MEDAGAISSAGANEAHEIVQDKSQLCYVKRKTRGFSETNYGNKFMVQLGGIKNTNTVVSIICCCITDNPKFSSFKK